MKTKLFFTCALLIGLFRPTQNTTQGQDTIRRETVAVKTEKIKDSIEVLYDSIDVNKKQLDAILTDSLPLKNERLEKVIDNSQKRGKKLDRLIKRVRNGNP